MSQYNVDYGVVKKPHHDRPLTQWEAEEWIKCAEDPWYFFTNYCYVIGPKGKTLFEPREYQIDMIDVIRDNRFVIINAPRQTGKTICMALYGLHEITFTPDTTTGVTSFKLTNVRDILKRLKYTYESLPDFLKAPVTIYNASEVSFTNHSSVYGEVTSESALRGKTVTGTAIIDEFAFTEPAVAEEFITSFLPALEAAGDEATTKVVIISTPNSSTGKYAEIVNGAIDGSNGWAYHKVDPSRISGRTESWKKQMIRKLGKNRYLQEFEGHFLSDNSSLVNSSVLEAIQHKEPVEEIGDLKLFTNDLSGRKVAIGVDVSEGVGKDNSCFQIFDIDSLTQVGEFANNMLNQSQYFKKIVRTCHILKDKGVDIDNSFIAIESNGVGNGILRLYENSTDDVITRMVMLSDVDKNGMSTGKLGLTTTNPKKMEGCGLLKDLIEEDKMTLYSHALLNELRMFTKQGATFKAERGAKDDRVMALVIVMNMLKQISQYEEGVFDVINEVDLHSNEDFSDIYF